MYALSSIWHLASMGKMTVSCNLTAATTLSEATLDCVELELASGLSHGVHAGYWTL